MNISSLTATNAWYGLLTYLLDEGIAVAPRGIQTREVMSGVRFQMDMHRPVIDEPRRKLNYAFMAAEALWIIDGRDDLGYLTQFNPNMAKFSDDGVTLAGAYGKRLDPQTMYVVSKLLEDRETRQAVASIWTPKPAPSKDIPCTLSMAFSIRNDKLNCEAFMRSSDAWLGIPYDCFSFTMYAAHIACIFNRWRANRPAVDLGTLSITPTSSHLYESNVKEAIGIVEALAPPCDMSIPSDLVLAGRWDFIRESLEHAIASKTEPGAYWTLRPGIVP